MYATKNWVVRTKSCGSYHRIITMAPCSTIVCVCAVELAFFVWECGSSWYAHGVVNWSKIWHNLRIGHGAGVSVLMVPCSVVILQSIRRLVL